MKRLVGDGRRSLVFGASLAAANAAYAADCTPASLAPVAGVVHSDWHERSASGAALVREEGTLARVGLAAEGACAGLQWALRWLRTEGRRHYDGATNTGFAVSTRSRLKGQAFSLVLMRPVLDSVSVGAKLGYTEFDRTIESTDAALGYPERYRYWSAAIGGRYTRALGDRLSASVDAWAGAGPSGRMWIDLPGSDPTELRLGSSRMVSVGLWLRRERPGAMPRGWSWRAGLSYEDELIRAGEPRVLHRAGIPVGSAAQPRSTHRAFGLFASADYAF